MTDRDDLRAAVECAARELQNLASRYTRAPGENGDRVADLLSADAYRIGLELRNALAKHPTPEPDDTPAMWIDPEPPGMTFRPFTDAEIAALDAEPPRGGDRLRERLRTDAEAAAKRPAHEKRHMPAIAESIAPTLQNPPRGGEVTAEELLALLPKRTHPECAAAILARYDMRRKP